MHIIFSILTYCQKRGKTFWGTEKAKTTARRKGSSVDTVFTFMLIEDIFQKLTVSFYNLRQVFFTGHWSGFTGHCPNISRTTQPLS